MKKLEGKMILKGEKTSQLFNCRILVELEDSTVRTDTYDDIATLRVEGQDTQTIDKHCSDESGEIIKRVPCDLIQPGNAEAKSYSRGKNSSGLLALKYQVEDNGVREDCRDFCEKTSSNLLANERPFQFDENSDKDDGKILAGDSESCASGAQAIANLCTVENAELKLKITEQDGCDSSQDVGLTREDKDSCDRNPSRENIFTLPDTSKPHERHKKDGFTNISHIKEKLELPFCTVKRRQKQWRINRKRVGSTDIELITQKKALPSCKSNERKKRWRRNRKGGAITEDALSSRKNGQPVCYSEDQRQPRKGGLVRVVRQSARKYKLPFRSSKGRRRCWGRTKKQGSEDAMPALSRCGLPTVSLLMFALWNMTALASGEHIEWRALTNPVFFGNDMEMMCYVPSSCEHSFTWFKDTSLIVRDNVSLINGKYESTINASADGVIYKLKIKHFNQNDVNAVYRCDCGFERHFENLSIEHHRVRFINLPENTDIRLRHEQSDLAANMYITMSKVYPVPNCSFLIEEHEQTELNITAYHIDSIYYSARLDFPKNVIQQYCNHKLFVICSIGGIRVDYSHFGRLRPCHTSKPVEAGTIVVFVVLSASVIVLFIVFLFCFIERRKRKSNEKNEESEDDKMLSQDKEIGNGISDNG